MDTRARSDEAFAQVMVDEAGNLGPLRIPVNNAGIGAASFITGSYHLLTAATPLVDARPATPVVHYTQPQPQVGSPRAGY